MPWAMTSGRPTDVANRSSQWIRLRSRLAPAYCTRRGTLDVDGARGQRLTGGDLLAAVLMVLITPLP